MTEPAASKFDVQQAARMTGATTSQLRYWNRIGFVPSTGGGIPGKRRWYSFPDLVVLRAVVGLKNSGCSIQRIRRLWQYLHTVDLQTVGVDPPVTEQSCECGNSASNGASNSGVRTELIPTLRNAAALGIPRTEDLDGDLNKGQAIFVGLLADVVEAVPADRFWFTDDVADRVAAQRDHLQLTATG